MEHVLPDSLSRSEHFNTPLAQGLDIYEPCLCLLVFWGGVRRHSLEQ